MLQSFHLMHLHSCLHLKERFWKIMVVHWTLILTEKKFAGDPTSGLKPNKEIHFVEGRFILFPSFVPPLGIWWCLVRGKPGFKRAL